MKPKCSKLNVCCSTSVQGGESLRLPYSICPDGCSAFVGSWMVVVIFTSLLWRKWCQMGVWLWDCPLAGSAQWAHMILCVMTQISQTQCVTKTLKQHVFCKDYSNYTWVHVEIKLITDVVYFMSFNMHNTFNTSPANIDIAGFCYMLLSTWMAKKKFQTFDNYHHQLKDQATGQRNNTYKSWAAFISIILSFLKWKLMLQYPQAN